MQSPAPTFLNTLNLWFTPVIDSTSCRDGTIQDLLSESENTRLNRIRSPNKRCEYLSGRALMRHALSREFQISEEQWQFIERPGLAPEVANLPDNTYLSLSHSRGLICFAVADSPVGIDIEASAKQRDFIALAEVFMNDEELEILLQQKSASADYFYRVWCAKEAYYKFLPAAAQASLWFSDIAFSSLLESNKQLHLLEGRFEGTTFAAILRNTPEIIGCYYISASGKCMDGYDRIEFR